MSAATREQQESLWRRAKDMGFVVDAPGRHLKRQFQFMYVDSKLPCRFGFCTVRSKEYRDSAVECKTLEGFMRFFTHNQFGFD